MKFQRDDYVKVVAPNGEFRYGYVSRVGDAGWVLAIDMSNEGASKIAFDAEQDRLLGRTSIDVWSLLSNAERKLLPMLAEGLTPAEIAGSCALSPVTVRSQLRSLRIKLHLDNNDQLYTYVQGLISLEGGRRGQASA